MQKKTKNLFIIYSKFLDDEGKKQTVGGIQRYILGLIDVFKSDFRIIIVQKSKKDFFKEYDNYEVCGFDVHKNKLGKELYHKIKDEVKTEDFIIWATDRISVKTNHKNTISIQHGITFDFIDYKNIKFQFLIKKSLFLSIIYRCFQQYNAVKYFLRSPKVVCVDYNFLNWIRTILPRNLINRAIVIPNFSNLSKTTKNFDLKSDKIKILFARRFVEYRGVYILTDIIEYFSLKYDFVEFGVFGEGPLESFLQDKFKKFKNVKISKYEPEKSTEIQINYNISIIPTYGSEGTSLSLLESMSCGCIPVASNVGGMTNIVVDGYNGFLVNPNSKEFIDKIEFLINNPDEMSSLGKNARATIESGFSFEKWKKNWKDLILDL